MRMPRLAYGLIPLLLAAVLPACERIGQAEPPGDAAPADSQPAVAQDAPLPSEGPTGQQAPGANGMDKTCQDTTFRITRRESASGDETSATALQVVGRDGKTSDIAKPKEMGDYTAVGLGCATAASNGDPYFIVQYGELPFGCDFCEWFYLYDAKGTQLTSSNPPLLTDASLPDGEQQAANTKEYELMIQKLGIEHPEVEYIK